MDTNICNNTENDFTIRVPLDMLQYTAADGKTYPISFKWEDAHGIPTEVKIDRIKSISTLAEQKSGTVGDRYECEIDGKIVLIYYTKLTPRKWFKIVPCTEQEYKAYYKLRGEQNGG
jgi:hypothetical protein